MKSPEAKICPRLGLHWNSFHSFASFYAEMLAVSQILRAAFHTIFFYRHLDLACCLTGYYPIDRTTRLVRPSWMAGLLLSVCFAKDAYQKLAVKRRHTGIISLVAGQNFCDKLLVGLSEQLFKDQKVRQLLIRYQLTRLILSSSLSWLAY